MNPSTPGWIEKFLRDLDDQRLMTWSLDKLYSDLRKVGFIYGNSVDTIVSHNSDISYSEEEKTKLNLFTALVVTYYDTIENANKKDCIDALIEFYGYLDTKKSFFSFGNVQIGRAHV